MLRYFSEYTPKYVRDQLGPKPVKYVRGQASKRVVV